MEPIARTLEPGSRNGPAAAAKRPGWRVGRGRPAGLLFATIMFVVIFVIQGAASAATTVTTHLPAAYAVTKVGAPVAPPATQTATATIRATTALAGLSSAGAQRVGTPGMVGAPTTLAACLVAGCRDRYIVASPAGLMVGRFAEGVTFSVPQPVEPPGVSKRFMIEIAIHTTAGWTVGRAYLATGTTTRAGGATITLQLFVNFGTVIAPTILGVQTVVDSCTSATSCP